jgi:hypothetical protein
MHVLDWLLRPIIGGIRLCGGPHRMELASHRPVGSLDGLGISVAIYAQRLVVVRTHSHASLASKGLRMGDSMRS